MGAPRRSSRLAPFRTQPRGRGVDNGAMNTVIAIGAALCVPVLIVLTLAAEARTDGWFQRIGRSVGRGR